MAPDITSRHHRIVAAFRSAARREGDMALLDGWHLLHDAFAAGVDLASVAISVAPPTEYDRILVERLPAVCEVVSVTTAVMNALSPARTPSGVVALARPRRVVLSDVIAVPSPLVMIVIDVQ